MSIEKIWWYAKEENQFGPYTSQEFKTLAAEGRILATDMVWKEGLDNWQQASSVKGLIPTNTKASPPPIPIPSMISKASSPSKPKTQKKMSMIAKLSIWIVGIFLGFVVLGIIVAPDEKDKSIQSSKTSTSQSKSSSIPSNLTVSRVKVGDTFKTPTFEIQIRSAQIRSSVGNSFLASEPLDGGIFLAIQWSYKNISPKPINTFRSPTLHLKAPDGTKYDPDIGASVSYATELELDSKVISDLNPGIRVMDADVFEVSEEFFDSASWKLLVDADQDMEVEFGNRIN